MLLIYNVLQIILVLLCLPCLALVVLLVPKYRGRTWRRLGFGLAGQVRGLPDGRPRIWIQALSVGEVASVRALVLGLRERYPRAVLILSVSTTSGRRYAENSLGGSVDLLLDFPLDFYWSVSRLQKILAPDLFVLVETDLWPNFLSGLRRHAVPAILVNGRISSESLARYRRFRRFFAGLFEGFMVLLMQSDDDVGKLAGLGIGREKIKAMGNLKYGSLLEGLGQADNLDRFAGLLRLLPGKTIWVAGSTHSGEEVLILNAYRQLLKNFPELYLILAPRNPDRAREVADLAARVDLRAELRSVAPDGAGDLLILDTMGELAEIYRHCSLALIGGSLVPSRGHNPLEPAVFGHPVVFGPHMEDFSEIAAQMLDCGAARQVRNDRDLAEVLAGWLGDPDGLLKDGQSGARLVEAHRGVTELHLDLIGDILKGLKGQ